MWAQSLTNGTEICANCVVVVDDLNDMLLRLSSIDPHLGTRAVILGSDFPLDLDSSIRYELEFPGRDHPHGEFGFEREPRDGRIFDQHRKSRMIQRSRI